MVMVVDGEIGMSLEDVTMLWESADIRNLIKRNADVRDCRQVRSRSYPPWLLTNSRPGVGLAKLLRWPS